MAGMRRVIGIDQTPPRVVNEPSGEGVYLLEDTDWPTGTTTLRQAAYLLGLVDEHQRLEWRRVHHRLAYLAPDTDGNWCEEVANIGRWPRGWRLNLSRHYRPALYAYCRRRRPDEPRP